MAEREAMLERIRKALGRPSEGLRAVPAGVATRPSNLLGVMPPIAPEELLPKFEAELQKVSGSACRASTVHELEEALRGILRASQAASAVLSRNPLIKKLGLGDKLGSWGLRVSTWPESGAVAKEEEITHLRDFKAGSFEATVGITGVDFALAETGSLVVSSLTEGSQMASLTPPVHVALYRRSQLVASLEEVLERLPLSLDPKQPSPGRSVVFITGTSRTADIEQVLIRGVHGPKEIFAILVEESCLA